MKAMRMMAVSAALFFASLGMVSCGISASGSTMSSDLSYSDDDLRAKPFKAIDVDVVADVYYTQNDGDECSVRLDYSAIKDADFAQTLKEKVKVVYRDGEVKIGCKGRVNVPSSANSEGKRLKIYITSPDIVKITQEGVGTFHAKTINTDKLKIDNEGVGSVTIEKILANALTVENDGVGSVRIAEVTGDNVKVENDGVGSVSLGFFKGGKLDIDNDGVGKVSAKVDCQSVKANLDGVGGIKLSGVTGSYDRNRDGVGSISDRDLKVRK